MKIKFLFFTVMILVTTSFSLANEEKEHICFRLIDSDQDDKVTFKEYQKYFGDDLEKFKAIDLDKDGALTHDEYHHILGHGSS